MKESISVVAAVIKREGKLLLCKRPPEKAHGGLWEFPGGKIEPNESIEHAVERELREELNLSVFKVGCVRFSTLDPTSGCIINFVDVEADGEPVLTEHLAYRWLSMELASKLKLAPSDCEFIKCMTTGVN